jgi:hypothetical protein
MIEMESLTDILPYGRNQKGSISKHSREAKIKVMTVKQIRKWESARQFIIAADSGANVIIVTQTKFVYIFPHLFHATP